MQENYSCFVALLVVAMTAFVALILFVAALVLWLAEWFGSIVVPCLIVGLFFALHGWAIYRFSLRDSIRHIEEQFGVIYDMMHLAREGVDAVTKLFFRT